MPRSAPIRPVTGQQPRPPLPARPPSQQTTQAAPSQGYNASGTTFTSGYHTRPVSDPGGGSNIPIGSTNVSAVMPDMSDFEPFRQSVFDEFQRSTAPEIEARRARMNQDLINRGLTPGSEGYEREMDRFMRMENDLFSNTQRSALEAGLAAQNQFFNQGLGQAQVNAGLAQARMGADASRYSSMMGAQASMYGADQNREGALERLLAGLNQQESEFARNLGQRGYEFDTNLGQRQYEFGRGMDLQEGQADMQNLGALANLFLGIGGFNNDALNSDYSRAFGALGQFMPSAPIIPVNVGGAYGTNLQGQLGANNAAQQGQDRFWGGVGALGSAALGLFSDRNAKSDIEPVDVDAELEAVRKTPVSRWRYTDDETRREHIGPMAQDFGANVTGEPDARMIHAVDAVGSLMASVQALADRVDALTERMEAASV